MVFLLVSCAVKHRPVCKRNGLVYGKVDGLFREQWSDYYERALSYMDGECYSQALLDLEAAIQQKNKDQKMARTTSLIFVDYFPHREKGVIYYYQKKYQQALQELTKSISQEPTSKAYYYINQVRSNLLKQTISDISNPTIHIQYPEQLAQKKEILFTKEKSFQISGVVRDEQYVSEVNISNRAMIMENGAVKQFPFFQILFLKQGLNNIKITAKNLMGGFTELQTTIYLDQSGPMVHVLQYNKDNISGYILDESGINSLEINKNQVDIQKGKKSLFHINLDKHHKHSILIAKDILGNETETYISNQLNTQFNRNQFLYVQNDLSGKYTDSKPMCHKNDCKIKITLHQLPESLIAYCNQININGQIESISPIKSIFVNKTLLENEPATLISFNQMIPLDRDINQITIRAVDMHGCKGERKIQVKKIVPQVMQLSRRYCIHLKKINSFSKSKPGFFSLLLKKQKSLLLDERFNVAFVKSLLQKKRFLICSKNNYNSVKNEIKSNIGHNYLKPAHALLSGRIYRRKNTLEVFARLVSTKTGQVLLGKDIYFEQKERFHLQTFAEKLTEKIIREFPMVDGSILSMNETQFVVGELSEMPKLFMPTHIYHTIYPERKWGSDTQIVGTGLIDELFENKYIGVFTKNDLISQAKHYRAITY
jgi:tetratricopeptide (TPR) repeat protein